MYLDFYQLHKAPFLVTPDPEFLFLSPSHKAALDAIAAGIESRQGCVLITGEVGVGKTTILRAYLERLPEQCQVIFVPNSNITFTDLRNLISRSCGLHEMPDELGAWLEQFQQFLFRVQQRGHIVALIIDEAQSLPLDTLARLPLLIELGSEGLLPIVLAGQPELKTKLQRPELQQVKPSILIRSTILPLTREESRAYLYHRLVKVTLQPESVFAPAALQRIVRYARGIPRVLNVLCTNALIAGYGIQQKPIRARTIDHVIADVFGKRTIPGGFRLGFLGVASLVVLGCAWWFWTAPARVPPVRMLSQQKLPLVTVRPPASPPRNHTLVPSVPLPLAVPLPPSQQGSSEPVPALKPPPAVPVIPSAPRVSSSDIPQQPAPGDATEDNSSKASDRAVDTEEQPPPRKVPPTSGRTKQTTALPQPQPPASPAPRPTASVPLRAAPNTAPAPIKQAPTAAKTPRPTAQRSPRVAESEAQKTAEARQSSSRSTVWPIPAAQPSLHVREPETRHTSEAHRSNSRGMAWVSPYTRGDDTGSSW